ncbi:MAG TPA: hypothetical protein VK675_02660 [Candidatus Paceibacterota bacterium]|nr:hypothetical protein [Candidatus Paceibacterota bacterium]
MKLDNYIAITCSLVALPLMIFISSVSAQGVKNARADAASAGVPVKVAPGEFLPVEVTLKDFGSGSKVDVLIKYSIFDNSNKEIYSTSDTVAVVTTASFVKSVQIPESATPGVYVAKTSIIYLDQLSPATTEFSFTVERKILGVFQSDLILYGGLTTSISVLMVLLGYTLVKRIRAARLHVFDYSYIPKKERVFYEILSDAIMTMRMRVGDDALFVASNIDGLKIDSKTGKVVSFIGSPSKIIATLVKEYEEVLGKKVSFIFRPKAKEEIAN